MSTKTINGFNFKVVSLKEGRGYPSEMLVRILKQGLYISSKASKFLTKEHVEIGYNEKKKAIAIQPSEETDISIKLTKQSKSRHIFSIELVRLIEKEAGGKKKFPCQWDEKEKCLIFKLREGK